MPAGGESLNPQQLHAVRSIDGPLLILAGAGSGKTRVITYRIAHLLRSGVPQSAILAVTFTNKAAREMVRRVRALCPGKLRNLTVSTFHAFGVRVLREHGDLLGYRRNFSIYDETDRQSLIKEAARDLGLVRRRNADGANANGFDAYAVASLFSRIKSRVQEWGEENEALRPLFEEYAKRLRLFNAVDFDDLIGLPIELLESHPKVRSVLQERFRYFLVDEFQDTSRQQYRLIRLLASRSGNVCVVGDDDQSIYSWRGAHFENIRLFEQDFPDFQEVKLEQNYRSTRTILRAANRLIGNNRNRKGKTLWSGLEEGQPLALSFPPDEQAEGRYIAETIHRLALKHRVPLSRFGVLVRTNSLTRAIEEAFVRQALPYQVSGGLSFFQRKEVKDIIAYLKVIANPDDDLNLLRIINTPRRGIGTRTLEAVVEVARARDCSLYSAISAVRHGGAGAPGSTALPEKAASTLGEFAELLESHRSRFLGKRGLAAALKALVEEIDYRSYLVQEHSRPEVARYKYANVEGLMDSLAAYEEDADVAEPSLYEYLNRITLASRDSLADGEQRQRVNLMTIHAAKGLEFDTVFIAGVERGLIPHERSLAEGEQNLEEERRLFYVAITRAQRRLHLSCCRTRRRRGAVQEVQPSPFLEELPQELIEQVGEEEELSAEEAGRLFGELKARLAGGNTR